MRLGVLGQGRSTTGVVEKIYFEYQDGARRGKMITDRHEDSVPGGRMSKYVKCEWCGEEIPFNENVFFTEDGRILDPGCYLTVFDEHFKEREQAIQFLEGE